MLNDFLDVLTPDRDESGRIYGVVVGIVTNNQDPQHQSRVKVRFPWLSDDVESWWARLAVPMAGKSRGVYFLPEVDDEVLVVFEQGDMRFPYVIGALWNGQDNPPAANADGANNIRLIRSRSGHEIRMDDTAGRERIEVVDKGGNKIVLNCSDNSITIQCEGKMALHANGIEIVSKGAVKVQAATGMDLTAGTQLNIKGAMVNIN